MVHASSEAVHLGLIVSSKHIRSILLAGALLALTACDDLGLGLGDGTEKSISEAVEDAENPVRQEFIELYNPSDADVPLDGWRLSGAVN